ncbi:MAG: RES family NAD+ phosphorylase, partial [SAR324 cluster bacterium]|nr:RES family NAD+ phosphorylase [SAR324 cluster bacterium]
VIHAPELLDNLQALDSLPWEGIVFRHMFAGFDPLLENRRGARWNPPEIPAIYTSLERGTALAEADYQISAQPLRPRVRRTIFRLRVSLRSVLRLDSCHDLEQVGVSSESITESDLSVCQQVGGAAEWLDHDGLLVPSARAAGTNLVIYPNKRDPLSTLELLDYEVLSE